VGARTALDPVKAGYPKWCGGFPPLLRLSDRSESNVGEGEGLQRTQSTLSPAPLLLLYTRSVMKTHNHQLIGAPDQGARSNGPRLDLVPLDTRWGQSNRIMPKPPSGSLHLGALVNPPDVVATVAEHYLALDVQAVQ
jgi:hypothetical protein